MGRRKSEQGQLFYAFDLDAVVPDDHQVRQIAAVLDLSWVRAELAPHYSHTGRPSIDPELMIRMLILGYVFAIRSERALCREVQLNLAYRWFCGLGIEDKIPDHSAFTRARNERFRDHDVFRRVFERVVASLHQGWSRRRQRLRGRCEPDRGGRQQVPLDAGRRMEPRHRSGNCTARRAGLSRQPR